MGVRAHRGRVLPGQLAPEPGRDGHALGRRGAQGRALAASRDRRARGRGAPRRGAATRAGCATTPATGEDTYEGFLAAASDEAPDVAVDPDWPVVQLYTGAFGGVPNGAQLSHRAVLAQDVLVAMVQRVTEDTVYLNSGPMFHMATLMTTFATMRMGGTNVLTRRVDAEELCRLIETERCNYGFVMGPTAAEILEVNKDGRYDLSSLRTFGGNAAWNAMVNVDDSPWGLHPAGYGQTEVTGMLTFNALGIGSSGTSGRPSPLVQVRIVDPDGAEVRDGETGEIVARGPIVTTGYHARPELNAERTRGGWWHTGDLGRREADGSITFVAPLTRIVKSAAENIYPAEVEACLAKHPAVKEAAIIGVPGPEVDPARGRGGRAQRRRGGERGGAHRALPGEHRLVQEALGGRVRRRAAEAGLGGRLRRFGRAVRRRRLPGARRGPLTVAAAPLTWDPYDEALKVDPHHWWARLRAEAPVYRNDRFDFWALSKFDDVDAALREPYLYSSAHGTVLELMTDEPQTGHLMIFLDPPDHTYLRRLVSKAFTPRRVALLEESIRSLCTELLATGADHDRFDLVTDYGGIIPGEVIATLLGVPEADRASIRAVIDRSFHLDPEHGMLNDVAVAAWGELHAVLAARRSPTARPTPATTSWATSWGPSTPTSTAPSTASAPTARRRSRSCSSARAPRRRRA